MMRDCWLGTIKFDEFFSIRQQSVEHIYTTHTHRWSTVAPCIVPSFSDIFLSFYVYQTNVNDKMSRTYLKELKSKSMDIIESTGFFERGIKNRDIFYWSQAKKRYILAWSTCKWPFLKTTKIMISRYWIYADLFNEMQLGRRTDRVDQIAKRHCIRHSVHFFLSVFQCKILIKKHLT